MLKPCMTSSSTLRVAKAWYIWRYKASGLRQRARLAGDLPQVQQRAVRSLRSPVTQGVGEAAHDQSCQMKRGHPQRRDHHPQAWPPVMLDVQCKSSVAQTMFDSCEGGRGRQHAQSPMSSARAASPPRTPTSSHARKAIHGHWPTSPSHPAHP